MHEPAAQLVSTTLAVLGLGFERAWWLWALLVLVPTMTLGALWLRTMSRERKWSALLLRAALILTLVGLLVGVSNVRSTRRLAVIAVVDVSGSVRSFVPEKRGDDGVTRSALERARAFLRQSVGPRGEEDILGLVVFDGSRVTIAPPRPGVSGASSIGRPGGAGSADPVLDRDWEGGAETRVRDATDIGAALRQAAAMFPPDANRRIVLISDGNETTGDALAAARAIGRDIPVDVVPLNYEVRREVIVEGLDAPARAAPDSVLTLTARLRATAPSRGVIRLLREGEPVNISTGAGKPGDTSAGLGRRVELKAGMNVVLLSVPVGAKGSLHRFSLVFEPESGLSSVEGGDTLGANNTAEAFTMTPAAGRVLLVDGVSEGAPEAAGSTLARALRTEGIDVDVVASSGVPGDLLALQNYDLIILQNVSAGAVTPDRQELLVRYVSDFGAGLVMIGGPDSFASGGWRGSRIEPILPVDLELPDQMVTSQASLILIIDTSGSMGASVMGSSRSQQDVANEGAAIAIRSLERRDQVGLIEFNSDAREVVPLQQNTNPDQAARAALALTPNGGTNMPPALDLAMGRLRNARTNVKHIVVLSDGQSMGAEQLPEKVRAMRREGITVSTIAVGDGADRQMMRRMAQEGGGAFYEVDNPTILPRIFLKAISVVRPPLIREEPFEPRLLASGSPVTAGLDSAIPRLGGLALTVPKSSGPDGRRPNITYAMLSPQGEPVMAHWSVGLGQVAAFTSDAHDRWASKWLDWPGYRQFWRQVVRSLGRQQASRSTDLSVTARGDQVALRLELTDDRGQPMDDLSVAGVVSVADGATRSVRLTQESPGVYVATVPSARAGNVLAVLRPQGADGRSMAPVIGGTVVPAGREYRALRSNEALLREVAQITGGREMNIDAPTPGALFDRTNIEPREARLPLWPVLMVWALVLLMLDVATRRVAWDRLLSRRLGGSMLDEAVAGARDRSEQIARSVGGLRRAPEPALSGGPGMAHATSPATIDLASPVAAPVTAGATRESTRASAAARAAQQEPLSTAAPAPAKAAGEAREGESALMAAKRRARERRDREDGSL
jgi:Ca-activated chloride channel family protein